jgi:hypothetical protein
MMKTEPHHFCLASLPKLFIKRCSQVSSQTNVASLSAASALIWNQVKALSKDHSGYLERVSLHGHGFWGRGREKKKARAPEPKGQEAMC